MSSKHKYKILVILKEDEIIIDKFYKESKYVVIKKEDEKFKEIYNYIEKQIDTQKDHFLDKP